jgi:hypothetical protein
MRTNPSRDRKGAVLFPLPNGRGSDRTGRRGSVAVELLLLTPIILGLVLAVIEIGTMTAANEHLAAASREGCRVAALGGGPDEIRRAVWNHLGGGQLSTAQITVVLTQQADGTPIVAPLTDSNGQPIDDALGLNGQSLNGSLGSNGQGFNGPLGANGQVQPIASGNPVLVRVETPALNAVPDLLAILGVSIQNSTLVGQTIMRKE